MNRTSRFRPAAAAGTARPAATAIGLSWITAGGERREVEGELDDFTSGGAVLRLPEAIEPGQTASLTYDMAGHRMIVTHCEKRGAQYLAVLRSVAQERRREDRLRTGGLATLLYMKDGQECVAAVQVRNCSSEGAQIEVLGGARLSDFARVTLIGAEWTCVGVVRYCHEDGDRFVAGLQLTEAPRSRRKSNE